MKKNSTKILIISLLIVIIAAGAILAVKIYKNKEIKKEL